MARIAKSGLEYFPFDIDFFQDIKIRKLIKRQGGKAVTVYALLLCLIYKNGYYMQWDEELPFICSELSGYGEAYISEVVNTCLSLGLFDKNLFLTEQVLTSKGIQLRYCNIQRLYKRMSSIDKYPLLTEEPAPTEPITPKKPTAPTFPTTPSLEERKQAFCNQLRPYTAKYPAEMLNAFYNYWAERNPSGTKMRFELEKTWELTQRLAAWARHDFPKSGSAKKLGNPQQADNWREKMQKQDEEYKQAQANAISYDEYKRRQAEQKNPPPK